jgi:hypothetical protein
MDQPETYWTARRTAGWSALGVAGVAGGGALYFEVRRLHFLGELRAAKRADPDITNTGDEAFIDERRHDRAADRRWLSLVFAGAFGAAGATLVFWPEPDTAMSFRLFPAGLEFTGSF